MAPLILHSYRRCPFAIRVRMVLEEKALDHQVIEEDLSNPSAALLKLHPEGRVPLLIHDGFAIHESAVITEYLDEAFPANRLMPIEARDRATVRLWTYWSNHILKPDLDAYKYQWSELPPAERAELEQRLADHLEKLTAGLVGREFLLGSALTLADIHVFPLYRQLQKAQPDFRERFKTSVPDQWLDRITARSSFVRVMKKPG